MVWMPQDKFIYANNLKLHYLEWGSPHTDPILLVHGIGANAHNWDFFARDIASGYRVIAPDLRGHGVQSDLLESETARVMVETLVSGSLVDIEHAGHSVFCDNPDGFKLAVTKFLGGC